MSDTSGEDNEVSFSVKVKTKKNLILNVENKVLFDVLGDQ